MHAEKQRDCQGEKEPLGRKKICDRRDNGSGRGPASGVKSVQRVWQFQRDAGDRRNQTMGAYAGEG